MFKFFLLLLTLSFTHATDFLEAGNSYELNWNASDLKQVNLELEVFMNGSWITHEKDEDEFLSIILDGDLGSYDWNVPTELNRHWRHNSRIKISDTETDNVILNRMFNFYGMSIKEIPDYLSNDTLLIEWNTNIPNNFTIYLWNNESKEVLVDNYNDNLFRYNLTGYPVGDYLVEIKYFIESENDNILSSCVGGRQRRSCVGGRRDRRGCCLRMSGSYKSNQFEITDNLENISDVGEDDDEESPKEKFTHNCLSKWECGLSILGIVLLFVSCCLCVYCCGRN